MTKYIQLKRSNDDKTVKLNDIPFSFSYKSDGLNAKNFEIGEYYTVDGDEPVSFGYFTGMVTTKQAMSDWWGPDELNANYSPRIFIGDTLGYLQIVYRNQTCEYIPLIFGLNIWNYEVYYEQKEHERGNYQTFFAPHKEPFVSDMNAKKLLDDARLLNEMDEETDKGSKFIMAVKLADEAVEGIKIVSSSAKANDAFITAATFLKSGEAAPNVEKIIEPEIFLNKRYEPALELLARRLYQFRDEIPARLERVLPDNYAGPDVRFFGNNVADILTNVYAANLDDIAKKKIDANGMPVTSSEGSPNFGCYVGFGTFRDNVGAYSKDIWSRDVGRTLMELNRAGCTERIKEAAESLNGYLYDLSPLNGKPNWKRIANAGEKSEQCAINAGGKENDGHGAIMLSMYAAYRGGALDIAWLKEHEKEITDAAAFIFWQIENPTESNFDKVLHSESEASIQKYGFRDLYSNTFAYYGLKAYENIARDCGFDKLRERCEKHAKTLTDGMLEVFVFDHPKFGKIFNDNTYDVWTYDYKRFALLFLVPDLYGFEANECPFFDIIKNTYDSMKESGIDPYSGRQMGYAQGWINEICALMDDVEMFSKCIEATAFCCYNQYEFHYMIPEGVVKHFSNKYWFRQSDLGNSIQQGEIMKSLNLIIGIDTITDKVNFIPRLTNDVDGVEVKGFKGIDMRYVRSNDGYEFTFKSNEPIHVGKVRLGPFVKGFAAPNEVGGYKTCVKEIFGNVYLDILIDKELGEFELNI
ncbi:MAG: hypothetical protein FWE04_05470 [Oscillospiraceae bacterium]|nr:hypothetical protein [Oscillospiraceae bacterium]